MLPLEPLRIPPEPPGPTRSYEPVTLAGPPMSLATFPGAVLAATIVSFSVAVPASYRPPLVVAVLPLTVQPVRIKFADLSLPRPAPTLAVLPPTVQPIRLVVPYSFSRPPPPNSAVLPLIVQPLRVKFAAWMFDRPPPCPAVLPLTVQPVRVRSPQ